MSTEYQSTFILIQVNSFDFIHVHTDNTCIARVYRRAYKSGKDHSYALALHPNRLDGICPHFERRASDRSFAEDVSFSRKSSFSTLKPLTDRDRRYKIPLSLSHSYANKLHTTPSDLANGMISYIGTKGYITQLPEVSRMGNAPCKRKAKKTFLGGYP